MIFEVITPDLEQAIAAWTHGHASYDELALGAEKLPEVLKALKPGEMPEGAVLHYTMVAAGMRSDYLKYKAAERLQSEGIE